MAASVVLLHDARRRLIPTGSEHLRPAATALHQRYRVTRRLRVLVYDEVNPFNDRPLIFRVLRRVNSSHYFLFFQQCTTKAICKNVLLLLEWKRSEADERVQREHQELRQVIPFRER